MTDLKEFKHCDRCGYETESNHIKFHKFNGISPRGKREDQEICDICYCNTGSWRADDQLSYLAFCQGLHWLNEQIKGIK